MPLSQEQIDALKNPRTVIAYQEENPKAPGTKAWDRYEKYKLDHTLARKNDSPTWCGVIVVVWCYCGGVVLLW